MDNLNIKIISGGYNNCSPKWSSKVTKDNCYKIYFPVHGKVNLMLDDDIYNIIEGNVYFINGYKLQEQICPEYMDVYWIHFLPSSLFLNKILDYLPPVYCWKKRSKIIDNINYKSIPELFDNPRSARNNVLDTAPLSLPIYINSFILLLISDMMENQKELVDNISYVEYEKLKPSIDFINNNYDRTLTLEEIAGKVYLNPIYFLRLFKKNFNITPQQYIMKKRLDEACSLLRETELTINDIANKLGFCNQFYFSKIFKRNFNKTPSQYRKLIILP
ncbi:AraC family transcriptional regulator [Vallitalea guaymasensis]|uniref:AraC family transcriptional regulator n=1 Tax=Vallitalea guaymasensis TaxID=1185412 RepID=UPI000DE2E862|nr:AraC family transcriptional regulator [Vallitalea guaymasensis]